MRHDVTRGECGMAAKLDLDGRCEPAQEVAFALRDEERGLGEIVLGGNRLHRRLRQPFGERAHRRRIAAEQSAGEGIDLIERNAHNEPRGLSTRAYPAGCRGAKQIEESLKAAIMVSGADGGLREPAGAPRQKRCGARDLGLTREASKFRKAVSVLGWRAIWCKARSSPSWWCARACCETPPSSPSWPSRSGAAQGFFSTRQWCST